MYLADTVPHPGVQLKDTRIVVKTLTYVTTSTYTKSAVDSINIQLKLM
jgi:hypothetical protein